VAGGAPDEAARGDAAADAVAMLAASLRTGAMRPTPPTIPILLSPDMVASLALRASAEAVQGV
jgi:hypothetical protein